MAYEEDKFRPPALNRPTAGIEYIAYIAKENMGDRTRFTCHKTVLAAEKKYGDLSKYYRGSSSTDYELLVLSIDEVTDMIAKGEIEHIDWKNRIIQW